MDNWQTASAADLGRAIGEGKLDPRDLAEWFLEAIAAHPDAGLIYARLTPERARIEAAAAHARQQSGVRAGPLDGVPISWKDNFDMAGVATEGGSRMLAGRVPERDCPALTHATQAGLVCLGKTHLSELAFSGLGLNPMTATPPNVWDRRRVPGGSSSGAAVSTALGLAAAGMGSDTGGSVRIPAAWNGLAGLKTTIGAVPCEGVIPLSTSFDTPGPLARTVEDCALLFTAMAGKAPHVAEAAMPDRLVVPDTLMLDQMEPEVAAAFDAAMGLLSDAGIAVSRAPVPEFAESAEVLFSHGGVIVTDAWRDWAETIEANPDTMFHHIEQRFRGGAAFTEDDAAHARAVQARLHDAIEARIAEGGVLIMPSSPILPPLISRLLGDEAYYVEKNLLALRNTRQANLLGLSSLTIPTATPMVGVMLVAGANEEDRLVAIGRALEPVLKGA
ncbi:amidase [Rhodobacteraceae bacterium NNCM2]|nr:amidase [Coraliihabitans acroporae]